MYHTLGGVCHDVVRTPISPQPGLPVTPRRESSIMQISHVDQRRHYTHILYRKPKDLYCLLVCRYHTLYTYYTESQDICIYYLTQQNLCIMARWSMCDISLSVMSSTENQQTRDL